MASSPYDELGHSRKPREVSYSKISFENLKKMISLRKEIPAFADNNDLEFIDSGNSHLLVFKNR